MKLPLVCLLAAATLVTPVALRAADEPIPKDNRNLSLRNEIQLAIDHGLSFLKSQQQKDGSWTADEPGHPALTAMPLIAFQREPSGPGRGTKVLNARVWPPCRRESSVSSTSSR